MRRLDVGVAVPAGRPRRRAQLRIQRRWTAEHDFPGVRPIQGLLVPLAERIERDAPAGLELLADHETVRRADRQDSALERHQSIEGQTGGTGPYPAAVCRAHRKAAA